jgi:E3 ubiquitin-protein ligase EDD1
MTFKELNNQYNSYHRRTSSTHPCLAVNRVKVTFKDEPGEGSGVARSFYTALAEVKFKIILFIYKIYLFNT